jgi:perosamine synthetase
MTAVRFSLSKPYFSEHRIQVISGQIAEILSSGRLMLGPFARNLEQGMADAVGVPYAVSVNSCTTALTIALKYYEVEGGEVLVPAASFVTDVSAVIFAGAKPVLVDLNPETLSFDIADLERKITPRTKAIIWVHLTGTITPEYSKILELARKHNLPVIEDAAQATGSTANGKVAGSLGDVGCFSFYPTKVMTCGTGGLMTTRDENLKTFAQELRMFGKDSETGDITRLGNDWFLDEIRACVAYNQFLELPQMIAQRRRLAARYSESLANQPGLRILAKAENFEPSYYQYPVLLDEAIDPAQLQGRLRSKHGIETKAIYKPTQMETVFREYDTGDLTNTTSTLARSLCLPVHPGLSVENVDEIVKIIMLELREVL